MTPGARCRRPVSIRAAWQRALFGFTVLLVLGAAGPRPAAAGTPAYGPHTPIISVIIDDMGYRLGLDRRAVALPGPVACAFLPRSPYTHELAILAHRRGKEVMLHLPMESIDMRRIDPGGMTLHMTQGEVIRTLQADLKDVPYVSGVNNHMGSLLTQHPGFMAWLMTQIHHDGGLFFVDSRTTAATVAQQVAMETGVPTTRRDVFLDDVATVPAVRAQFGRLIALAREKGSAVAIGHPRPATLTVLEQELPALGLYGVRLVPVTAVIERQEGRQTLWRASLSR